MALTLSHYRFGIDSGTESGHGWHANEDANPAQGVIGVDVNFLLRFCVQANATGLSNVDNEFQYRKNGGAWTNITTSSANVRAVNVTPLTEGGNCTKRLSGTGTFESSGAGQTEDGISGGAANDIVASGNSETECGLQIVGADVAHGDLLEFRLTRDGGVLLDTYSVVPAITVHKPTIASGTGTVAGLAACLFIGASIVVGQLASAGAGTVSAVGSAVVTATGSAAGVATVSAVGGTAPTIASGDASVAGIATLSGHGASIATGLFTWTASAGTWAEGAATKEALASATGSSTVAGVGSSTAAGVSTMAGVATVNGVGGVAGTVEEGTATCAGSSTVTAVGCSVSAAVASLAGSSTVNGIGQAIGGAEGLTITAIQSPGSCDHIVVTVDCGDGTACQIHTSYAEIDAQLATLGPAEARRQLVLLWAAHRRVLGLPINGVEIT